MYIVLLLQMLNFKKKFSSALPLNCENTPIFSLRRAIGCPAALR